LEKDIPLPSFCALSLWEFQAEGSLVGEGPREWLESCFLPLEGVRDRTTPSWPPFCVYYYEFIIANIATAFGKKK